MILLLLLAIVASSHFLADFPNSLKRIRIRIFRVFPGLAFVLKTEHIFYECIRPLYRAWGMFRFHEESFQFNKGERAGWRFVPRLRRRQMTYITLDRAIRSRSSIAASLTTGGIQLGVTLHAYICVLAMRMA
jgi:hypothetical protein